MGPNMVGKQMEENRQREIEGNTCRKRRVDRGKQIKGKQIEENRQRKIDREK